MESGTAKGVAWVERQFGKTIKAMREARGWTQTDLATKLGTLGFEYHQTTIGKLESGARPLRIGELFAMAAVFGVSAVELVRSVVPAPSPDDAETELPWLERESERARTAFISEVETALEAYTRTQRTIQRRRTAVGDDG
jgi:transcriptional regulator with XRE-family HTH domain